MPKSTPLNASTALSCNTPKESAHNDENERETQKMLWRWTLVNYTTEEETEVIKCAESWGGKWVFGYEICPTTGSPHLQGFVKWPGKCSWTQTVKRLNNKRISVRECDKSEKANVLYCCKDGVWKSNYLTDHYIQKWGIQKKEVPITDLITNLKPFQLSIRKLLTGPVMPNKIHWVYDNKGQIGKTEMVRYMYVNHGVPFAYGGKSSDIMNLVFNNRPYFTSKDNAAMIFNFTRVTDPERISYSSLEQISDGAIVNTKFECGCFVCNKPHVMVFANCLPLFDSITLSRWMIYTIINDELTLDNTLVKSSGKPSDFPSTANDTANGTRNNPLDDPLDG